MQTSQTIKGGRAVAHTVVVWDPLVRLIHWGLALTILLNGAFIDEEGSLHKWIGYTAVGLIGVRLVWGMIGPRHARFSAFPPNPVSAIRELATLFKGDKIMVLRDRTLVKMQGHILGSHLIATSDR